MNAISHLTFRSKQNLDYAAIMEFSSRISHYYLHLEDDIEAAFNYIQATKDFIKDNKEWAMLEVTVLLLHLHEIVKGLYFHCSLSVCLALLVNKMPAERMNRLGRCFC